MSNKKSKTTSSNKSKAHEYRFDLKNEKDIDKLCSFLKTHDQTKANVKINNKLFRFKSKLSRQSFGEGFSLALTFLQDKVRRFNESLLKEITKKNDEISKLKNQIGKEAEKYRVKNTVLELEKRSWLDKIAELERDREYLSRELKKCRNQ